MRGLLKVAAFRRLLVARTAIVLGNAVAPIALAFAVLDLTRSPAGLGFVLTCRASSSIAVLLVGGLLADRFPAHRVLALAAGGAAATEAATGLLLLGQHPPLWSLAVLSGANGIASGLALPAATALVRSASPPDLLRQANAVLRIAVNTASISGAGLGAVLIAATSPAAGILLDAATFAVGAVVLARLPARAVEPSAASSTLLTDLRHGWGEFTARPWVWISPVQASVKNGALVGAIAVLGPVVADATFGRAAWGLVLAAMTGGLLLGGLLAVRWAPARPLSTGVALTAFPALPLLALAWAPRLVLLVPLLVGAGIAVEQFGVAWDHALQREIPPERLGRVASYDALGSFLAVPVGEALVGPLAGALGTASTLTGCAALIVAASAVAATSCGLRAR